VVIWYIVLQVPVVSEKQFLLMIQNSFASASDFPSSSARPNSSSYSSSSSSSSSAGRSLAPLSRVVKGQSSTSSSASLTRVPSTGLAPNPHPSKPHTAHQEESQQLWVDKYRPAKLEDVIGGAESVKKLLEWLRRWHDVHIHKTAKVGTCYPSYWGH
jgi:hypothetical protein